jgi:type IV pilus assembly protein PilB
MGFKKLGEILVELGLITEDGLRQSLNEQKITHARLGDVIVSRGLAVEEDIYCGLAQQMGIDFC